jgi:hypothetical protein
MLSAGHVVTFIDLWSVYCPTVRKYLCFWAQLFVRSLRHSNTTGHNTGPTLFSTSLHCAETVLEIDGLLSHSAAGLTYWTPTNSLAF